MHALLSPAFKVLRCLPLLCTLVFAGQTTAAGIDDLSGSAKRTDSLATSACAFRCPIRCAP